MPIPESGETLLRGAEIVETQLVLGKLQPDPGETDLLQKKQIIVGNTCCIQAMGQFDFGGFVMTGYARRRLREKPGRSGTQKGLQKTAPVMKHRHLTLDCTAVRHATIRAKRRSVCRVDENATRTLRLM
jgi:hypothetical protein